jgi:hypothetical protein
MTAKPRDARGEATSEQCPLCRGPVRQAFTASDLNRAISSERFEYGRCRFGWEYALRRSPRNRPPARASRALSLLIARALRPIETRGLNGCAYTSVFVKSSA